MADLLQEFMDDMRADRVGDLWKKYGKWVIYTAVSIVIVTAVTVFWKEHQRNVAMQQTALYFTASDALSKGDAAEALASLDKITVAEKSPYHALALLKKAEAHIVLGKNDEAKKLFVLLAKREDMYGDIGKVLVKQELGSDATKTAALPFARSEWAAWELAAKGERIKAAEQFAALAKMENAPSSLRDRAQMMASYLKNRKEGATHE